jgi:hypothetical protein
VDGVAEGRRRRDTKVKEEGCPQLDTCRQTDTNTGTGREKERERQMKGVRGRKRGSGGPRRDMRKKGNKTKQSRRKQTPKHRGTGTALTPRGTFFPLTKKHSVRALVSTSAEGNGKGKQYNPYAIHNNMHCQPTERMK